LWNAARFVVEHAGAKGVPVAGGYPEDPGPEGSWVLSRLAEVAVAYDRHLDAHRFSDAVATLFNFAWSEVFDWYLEMAKPLLAGEPDVATATRTTLGVVLRDVLALLHPVMPFVTEELWSELGDGSLLAAASWPSPPGVEAPEGTAELFAIVTEIRRFRAEHSLGGRPLDVRLDAPAGIDRPWWRHQLASLARVTIAGPVDHDAVGAVVLTADGVSVQVPMAGLVDVAVERSRLEKAIAEHEALLEASVRTLANPRFRDRAPAAVVEKEQAKCDEFTSALGRLRRHLAEIGPAT
jgi:valyl-tRNA synthetase